MVQMAVKNNRNTGECWVSSCNLLLMMFAMDWYSGGMGAAVGISDNGIQASYELRVEVVEVLPWVVEELVQKSEVVR